MGGWPGRAPSGLPRKLRSWPVVGEGGLSHLFRLWWVGLMFSGCRLPAPSVECMREPGPGRLLGPHVPWAGLSRPLDFPCNVWGFRLYSVGIRKGCLFHFPEQRLPQPAHRCQCPSGEQSPLPHTRWGSTGHSPQIAGLTVGLALRKHRGTTVEGVSLVLN